MEVPGFYFCVCPDMYLTKRYIDEFLTSLGNVHSLWQNNVECLTFWPDELEDSRFWNALTMQTFSANAKCIIIRQAHTILAQDWKKISQSLASARSGILPIFSMEGAWEKNAPKIPAHITKLKCFEFAKSKNWYYSNIGINEKNIQAFVGQEAKKLDLQLDKNTLVTLCESAIPDAYFIHNLLLQLSLYAEHGKVDSSVLAQITAYTSEMQIFNLINDMENARLGSIWKRLSLEDDKGESYLFPLLALLSKEARTLWQLCAGESPYIFPTKKEMKLRQAKKLGFCGVSKIFQLIFESDFAVKSGKNNPLQVLENFIVSYAEIFSPSAVSLSKVRMFETERDEN